MSISVDVLVVAGGGSGGYNNVGGGGGAGGVVSETSKTVANGNHSIVIGAGGASLTANGQGNDGDDSTAFGITAVGGGGAGGSSWSDDANKPGRAGGSGGGGGGGDSSGGSGTGGTGTSGQGNNGGTGYGSNTTNARSGGGGGGAGAVGANASYGAGGAGGAGISNSITGSAAYYGGGGGGSSNSSGSAAGGSSIGGAGASSGAAGNGSVNTGSGGGGGAEGSTQSGAGGSGVVIIRYDSTTLQGTTVTGGTITTDGNYKIHTFTSGGIFSIVPPIITALDQPYDLARDPVLAALDQQYALAVAVSSALVQTWGLVLETSLDQRYGDASVIDAALNQYYDDAYPVLTGLDQRWGDTVELTTALVQQYNLMYLVEQGLTQEWSICGTPVDTGLTQTWDLRIRNEVMAALAQYYNLMRDGSTVRKPSFYVMADGVLLHPSLFSWTISEGSAAIEATVTLPDKAQWNSVQLRGAMEIFWQGRLYDFFVEAKRRVRSIDNSKKFTADYILVGQSLTAGLEAPYAMPITREYPDTVMASTIIADLADGITIDWQIDDFPVTGGTFFVNSETPLTAIKKLIGDDTVKAIVQTSHDGKLIVRRDLPVSPADWPTSTPDHVISDDGGVFSDSDDMDIMPGYNMIEISSELTSDTGKRLSETIISPTQKEVRGISVPWEDDFPLETSGGSWVVIEECGIIIERIEDEQVEIVDGTGRTQYPVYSQVSAGWLQAQLGTITAAEDGSLTTELQGNSLAKISYDTKYRKWIVHDPKVESVQVYILEEVAA